MYIYRKSDLSRLSGIQDESQFKQVFDDCIKPNYGGTESDYATIETNLKRFHLENVNGVVVAVEDGLTIEEQKQTILTELEKPDMQLIDELIEFCETKGFKSSTKNKNIVEKRKLLKQQLQDLEV